MPSFFVYNNDVRQLQVLEMILAAAKPPFTEILLKILFGNLLKHILSIWIL